jgi:hypothetical protein
MSRRFLPVRQLVRFQPDAANFSELWPNGEALDF